MGYVAVQPLRWGDGDLNPGDPVPAGEPGRDYDALLRTGQIAEVNEPEVVGDKELLKRLKQAEADRDDAIARAEAAEANVTPATGDEDEIPDGVVPGETPGWPVGLFLIPLAPEQRAELADAGISGTLTPEDLAGLLTPAEETPAEEPTEPDQGEDALPDGVTDLGGGWYLLPDGETKAHGKKALADAIAAK